ncbi:ankyrin repeat-containing domain protein [Dactylonectria estremocensis]|uniref:Ankyrin repeat-containing domain protein n=1 Tax=Dactylonectria estremocensis TaxID=1079267 RepID=A0A9P9DZD2_9HYPO|nr:ankyrin repeat-containing domain protein [Dactylonectria estremocensis]
MARLLLQHGADITLNSHGGVTATSLPIRFPLELSGTPLDVAVSVGRLHLVKLLLELGSDPLVECMSTPFKRSHNSLELGVALHVHEIVDAILGHLSKKSGGSREWKETTSKILPHLAGHVLGGKGLFWKWLLHGSQYREACRRTVETCLKYGVDINGIGDDEGNTALVFAARQNPCHQYVLDTLLLYGADPNIKNMYGSFPLSLCLDSAWGSMDWGRCVQALLESGADPSLALPDGRQPIHVHATGNMAESVARLLDAGADIEARENDNGTPLTWAAMTKAYSCVEALLDGGADMEAWVQPGGDGPGYTAIGAAALAGATRVFQLLARRGAQPWQPGNGGSVLHLAAATGHADILRLALRRFPDTYRTLEMLSKINRDGYSALHVATSANLSCVRELVLAGAPLDLRDPSRNLDAGHTPLGASIQGGAYDVARFMLQNGASPFCRGPAADRRWSFLCEALFYARKAAHTHPHTFAALLDAVWQWVDEYDLLRVRDFGGRTALQFAIYYGLAGPARILVERGASVHDRLGAPMDVSWETTDFEGLTCLQFARAVRGFSPKEREQLYDPDSFEISDESIDAVIAFLEEETAYQPRPKLGPKNLCHPL